MSVISTRELILLPSTTATTNGTGNDMVLPGGSYHAAILSAAVSTNSGTSPTLDIKVQNKLGQPATTDLAGNMPTGTAIYDDMLAFTQITTNPTKIMRIVAGPIVASANTTVATGADYAQLDGSLTAGNVRVGPIGGLWRIKYVIGGTSPSFTFSVTVQLIPFGSA